MDNAKPTASVSRCNIEHLFVMLSSLEVIFYEFSRQKIQEGRSEGCDESALDHSACTYCACSECCRQPEHCNCRREGQ
jgi:hypothetical protein